MILHTFGDSHAAGGELYKGYCFQADDPDFPKIQGQKYEGRLHIYYPDTRQAHPECAIRAFPQKIADHFNITNSCRAVSGASNESIIHTALIHGAKSLHPEFILIGTTSWERERWIKPNGGVIDVSAGMNTDDLSDFFKRKYEKWVLEQTEETKVKKAKECAIGLRELSSMYENRGIPHLIYNGFDALYDENYRYDFGPFYFKPFDKDWTFYEFAKRTGNLIPGSYHANEQAHKEWADILIPEVQKVIDFMGIKL